MGVHERLERRKQLLAERRRAKPKADAEPSDAASTRRSSGGLDLSGFEGIAMIFPPAAIVLVLALPIIAVSALLRRNR